MTTCKADLCDRPVKARGLCTAHYERLVKGRDVNAPMRKRRETLESCTVPECNGNSFSRGLCQMHYWRWRTKGEVGPAESMRPGGSRVTFGGGYVKIHMPSHPASMSDGYMLEHRLVMENAIGRYIVKGESVHHINGQRGDNRPENLELWVSPQPAGQRPEDLVRWVIDLYPDLVRELLPPPTT